MGSTAASMALQMGMEYLSNSQNAKTSNRVAQAKADAQTASIKRATEIEERRKREALKRITATQRARFGAQGVGGRGGSADSVLGGFARNYENDIADSRLLADGQIRGLQSTVGATQRANLLDASTATRRFVYSALKKKIPQLKSLLE